MKKILSVILALTLVCALAVTAAAAGVELSTDKAEYNVGDTVTVTIALGEAIPEDPIATAIGGELTFDPAVLTFVSAAKDTNYSFLTVTNSVNKTTKEDNGLVKISWFDLASGTNGATPMPAGTVVVLTFTADDTLKSIESALSLTLTIKTGTNEVVLDATDAVSITVNHAHTWDDGVVTKEPTCTETGVKTYTCSACGETKTEEIAAKGHSWDNGVVTKEPTCTEKGEKTYTCSVCGETKTEEIAAKGHSWDNGVVTKEPTCTEKGEMTYTCACGETKTEEIDALGHSYKDGVCERCGEKDPDYVAPTTEPTTTPTEGEKDDVPETGDNAGVIIALAVVSALSVAAYGLKRKEN